MNEILRKHNLRMLDLVIIWLFVIWHLLSVDDKFRYLLQCELSHVDKR